MSTVMVQQENYDLMLNCHCHWFFLILLPPTCVRYIIIASSILVKLGTLPHSPVKPVRGLCCCMKAQS